MYKRSGFTLMLALLLLSLAAACAPSGSQVDGTLQPTAAIETAVSETAVVPTETTVAPTQEATATAAAEGTATIAAPAAALDEFISELKLAIDARDFPTLEGFMSDPFIVGYWLSEGVESTPTEAVAQFETNFLPEGAQIIWADPQTDLSQILQGQPPATFLAPGKELAAALLSYGWGPDAGAEAIQFITRQPDGTFKWEMMLYSGFGFTGLPTDVVSVLINSDEATFYSGPGATFNPVATVFGGQTYPVIGVSLDSEWWRLRCYDDNNVLIPQCWVSADPAITTPAMP
jgi:hypothetical protein